MEKFYNCKCVHPFSTVCSIFDPLGLIAPIVLIMQEICRDKRRWNEEVSTEIIICWKKCRSKFRSLCIQMLQAKGIRENQYRWNYATSLIPVLAAFSKKQLGYENVNEVFWTDSKVVLGYISNEDRRFHVFVSNIVQEIRESTEPEQWKYVKSCDNPADLAKRGSTELAINFLWWTCPTFLHQNYEMPRSETIHLLYLVMILCGSLKDLSNPRHHRSTDQLFESWFRAKPAVALCLGFMQLCAHKVSTRTSTSQPKDHIKK